MKSIQENKGFYTGKLRIYSKPQALIIKNKLLYYRGNYKKARFCTSLNTKFAEMALRDALYNKKTLWMQLLSTTAYRSELPSNENHTTANLFNFLK